MDKREAYQFHYGFSGNKKQPLILLLHGFMGNSDDFNGVVSLRCPLCMCEYDVSGVVRKSALRRHQATRGHRLSKEFCCLAVDLPGHGKTQVKGGEACYKMSNTAQRLIDLLDELKIDKCSLVGYYLGRRLGLYPICTFPSRFEKVILESATRYAGIKNRSREEELPSSGCRTGPVIGK